MSAHSTAPPCISVSGLTIAYGDFILMRDISFTVRRGDMFIIMGSSGCGKSTLLRVLMGLKHPDAGSVRYTLTSQGEAPVDFWRSDTATRQSIMRRAGVLFQGGALWSSMTLAENIMLPLQRYADFSPQELREQACLKLALAGLAGFEDYYPAEISGGMRKRAGLARALALDPEIIFLDEPSAGLDPVSARLLDDLLLQLCDTLGTTFVVVTHELASLFAIGSNSAFLDVATRTLGATGKPLDLLHDPATNPTVRRFLTRGEKGNNEDTHEQ